MELFVLAYSIFSERDLVWDFIDAHLLNHVISAFVFAIDPKKKNTRRRNDANRWKNDANEILQSSRCDCFLHVP